MPESTDIPVLINDLTRTLVEEILDSWPIEEITQLIEEMEAELSRPLH
jgi:hypothetical protein